MADAKPIEVKELQGIAFLNGKYEPEGRMPKFRGKVMVQGHEYELSVWVKTAKNGNEYVSLALSEPYQRGQQPPASSQTNQPSGSYSPF